MKREKLNTHQEVNKLTHTFNTKRMKYCPIISKLLNKKNVECVKNPIIMTVIEYLNIFEIVDIRRVCKKWNNIIKDKLDILKRESFISAIINNEKENRDFNFLDKNNNEGNINNLELFENSNKKYSKKRTLVRLISSKNFFLLKKRSAINELALTRNLLN